ncbi:MAG: carbohydrate kinase [Planctomycetota bacterium]|jgi:fructokinase|nr:carbohydrate kinase [Planctomycetota bacterium]
MSKNAPLVVCIGEILWDVLPTGKVLGGAPANVAWHASQLGADSRIVSAVGRDEMGREMGVRLREMGMDCEFVFPVDGKPTGKVDACVNEAGIATYVIGKDAAWDFIPVSGNALSLVAGADALNFGTLVQRLDSGRRALEAYLAGAPAGCLRMFDVNLRPGGVRRDVLEACFARCDMVKLNSEELLVVSELFNWPGKAEKVLDSFFESYPNISHVVVTRGPDGVWWQSETGLLKRPGRTVPVADTIGAGDSLSAAVIMGLLRKMPPEEIIETALDISGFVCTQIGATPLLPESMKKAFHSLNREAPI